ncbi:SH3 domain-containing protein [Polaromonas sp.]|uniref:SH3 domain-containing protein n=1 Tax=Polaromonas sp. TaxID=1869339 RepID=UPI003561AB54
MTRLKSLPLLLLSSLLLLLLLLLLAQAAHAREMVSVNRSVINMREGVGTQHDALWALNRGYPLEVTGRKGKWFKVRDFENDTGWVYRPLVGKTPHHVVKSRVANIRSGPSTGNRIVGKAQQGDVLRTLERRDRWVKVQQEGGLKGWVARRLLWGW